MESQSLVNGNGREKVQGLWFRPRLKEPVDGDKYMIYMIPGNPCLMTFYGPFLSTLFSLLDSEASSRKFSAHVGGYTLPGFESTTGSRMGGVELPASLRSQVRHTEELIKLGHNNIVRQNTSSHDDRPPKVILIAHSVGAYIALEILRRRVQGQNDMLKIDIVGGVFVCPTIVDIAQSPQGAKMNRLVSIPHFPAIAGALAKLVTFLLPISALQWLITFLARVPPHIAQANAEWLKSPYGVQQAFSMAKDNMHEIKEDTWDQAIWGSPNASSSASVPLKFYFAGNDEWVPSPSRDALIRSRGRLAGGSIPEDRWKPEMFIDENKVPHAFIINHSEFVAEKVKSMIEDIIDKD
ncbi:MAG: hypothetical protein M1820_000155 [Bogoriella megaspora]|nr:MAG: hypothetical protein M1820_000155 [Bogoriella megaspora]